MNILFLMIPISIFLAFFFLGLFIWSNQNGQYEDLISPAFKALDENKTNNNKDEK